MRTYVILYVPNEGELARDICRMTLDDGDPVHAAFNTTDLGEFLAAVETGAGGEVKLPGEPPRNIRDLRNYYKQEPGPSPVDEFRSSPETGGDR